MVGDVTVLTGRSGAQYQFTIYPRLTTFTPKGGVYVMGRAEADNRYAFCYVGHTGDFSVRPFAKDKTACFDQFRADSIFILDETSANRRVEIAQDLISAYAPTCNTL